MCFWLVTFQPQIWTLPSRPSDFAAPNSPWGGGGRLYAWIWNKWTPVAACDSLCISLMRKRRGCCQLNHVHWDQTFIGICTISSTFGESLHLLINVRWSFGSSGTCVGGLYVSFIKSLNKKKKKKLWNIEKNKSHHPSIHVSTVCPSLCLSFYVLCTHVVKHFLVVKVLFNSLNM